MYKVLIADDESIEREYLKSIFAKYPKQFILVDEACNGVQAMNKALLKEPDIILMDINMPVCNGLIAARNIKEKLTNSIIILNTAYAEFEYARQAVNYNLDSYLLKPASEEDILNTIKSCINQKLITNKKAIKDTSISVNKEYPFSTIEKLIYSIIHRDLNLMNISIAQYLDFFNSRYEDLNEYKLYILNTVFSILVTMKEILPQNIYILLDSDQYLQKINNSEGWQDVIIIIDNLLKKVQCLLDNQASVKSNCADLIQKYIDENYQHEISLEELSNIFHYSPSYISRIFHKEKNITINNYINKVRISYSISLLTNSNLSIKEIALGCGFINISHFNRVFKNMTGKTPTNIREGR